MQWCYAGNEGGGNTIECGNGRAEFIAKFRNGVGDLLCNVVRLEGCLMHSVSAGLLQIPMHFTEVPLKVAPGFVRLVSLMPLQQTRFEIPRLLHDLQPIIDEHFIRPR